MFLLGALTCVVHIVLAMSNVHGWSHAAAMEATAEQTDAVYGVRWGGGLFVNYVFAAVWIADALQRVATPAAFARRPSWFVWTLRAFYFVIIVNAAVIFATPGRRWIGVVICLLIAGAWSGQPRTHMKNLAETQRTQRR